MSVAVLADLGADAARLYDGGESSLDAALAAKQQKSRQVYVANEPCNWSLLEQLRQDPAQVRVQLGQVQYQAAEPRLLQGDSDTLVLPLQPVEPSLRERKHSLPIEGDYSVRVGNNNQEHTVRGSYNLGEVLNALAPEGLSAQQPDRCVALALPLAGLVDEQLTAAHQLPTAWLEVGARISRKNLQQADAHGALLRIDPRGTVRVGAPQIFSPSSRAFWYATPGSSAGAYTPPAPRELSSAQLQQAAAELTKQLAGAPGDHYSMYVYRDGKQLLALESGNKAASSRDYDIGELTQLLTVPALIQYALSTAPNARLAEVILHQPGWLGAALRAQQANELADAVESLYRRNQAPMPTLAQLLTHTSGLPHRVQLGVNELQWMITGAAASAGSVGALQRELAQMIDNKTQLLARPGEIYHPSALAFALLAFTVPGEKAAPLLETVQALAGDTARFASSRSDSNFQGAYFLYSGLRVEAAALARALARPAWFEHSADREPLAAAPHMNWLWRTARPQTTLRDGQVAAGYGAWMTSALPMPERGADARVVAAYAVGTHEQTVCTVVQLPQTGAMALLCVEKSSQGTPNSWPATLETVQRMAALLDSLHDAQPQRGMAPQFRMPDESRAMMLARQRAERVLQTTGTARQRVESMQPLLGDYRSLTDEDSTATLALRETAPGRVQRYVLTVRRGVQTAEYLVVYDAERAADRESPTQAPGGLRVIDPFTHVLSSPVDFAELQSARLTDRSELVMMFDGAVYGRQTLFDDMVVRFDESDPRARSRAASAVAQREKRRARLLALQKARAEAKRTQHRDDDLSSDDEDDGGMTLVRLAGEQDYDDERDNIDDEQAVAASSDLFVALDQSIGGDRTKCGRWHRWLGTDRNVRKSVWLAYPAGARLYVLAEYVPPPVMPYY